MKVNENIHIKVIFLQKHINSAYQHTPRLYFGGTLLILVKVAQLLIW